ncbi:MAG: transcriptional regulator [Legionellales bacterium]|nr:transcriptional regulator [Legionellales bacterium]
MGLTRTFKETIRERAIRDRTFRHELLKEAMNELFTGDFDAAKLMLRDFINATSTFEPLADKLHKSSKSLQRMLGPQGNPTTQSLVGILHQLQTQEGIRFKVSLVKEEK